MDLGKARLRKIGLNNLHCAVHPQHGVIWTDGKGIYLAPIVVEQHQVQNAASVKLGEFDKVASVHWSSCMHGDACHMCVVHEQNVTVWRVSGALPRLNFKQVRKINVRPIPQGCLWNPCNDVLCLLSAQQCSFYFRHDLNKGSYAFPALESGKILCGCWSPDGRKLVLCVGSALLIYRWVDVGASVSDFAAAAWRIPGLAGQVTSVSPVLKDSVVVAAEVPLESLCKQQDMFRMPEINGHGHAESDGVIRPNKSASATQSLMNLERNTQVSADAQSSLTMIQLHDNSKDPTKLSSVPLKGVLSPDILLYEKSSQCVVVGSNSQSQLHIYALLEKHLAYCGDIQLDKGQRPKGLCSMPTFFDEHGAALLILVGQRENEESALLSPSPESEFKLSLKYIILKAGRKHRSKQTARGESVKSRSSAAMKTPSLVKSESMKEHRMKNVNDQSLRGRSDSLIGDGQTSPHSKSPEAQVRVPLPPSSEESLLDSNGLGTQLVTDHIVHRAKMIEELSDSSDPPNPDSVETESVPFSSQSPSFKNSKLSETYDLNTATQNKSKPGREKTHSSHNASPRDSKSRETNRDHDRKSGSILKNSPSRQLESQSSIGKYLHTEQKFKETDCTDSRASQRTCEPEELISNSRISHTAVHRKGEDGRESDNQSGITVAASASSSLSGRDSPRSLPLIQHSHLPSIEEVKAEMPEMNQLAASSEILYGKEDSLSDLGLGSSQHSADSSWDSMERQIKSQKDSIEALQQRLEELAVTVEESRCVFPVKYQDMSKPEVVEIYCEKTEGTETKRFLLDNGRLQLEPVKHAFGLATVELWLDGVPCVLGSNVDGYIPMRFSPSEKLHISGLPADRYPQSIP